MGKDSRVLKNSAAAERIHKAEFAPSFFGCELTAFLIKQVAACKKGFELVTRLPRLTCGNHGLAFTGLAWVPARA
jgi:hypothetical protein